MKIVFMGTPEFAVPTLEILINHGYDIVGVVTATDKLGGRGKKTVLESAVKKFAIEKGLNILLGIAGTETDTDRALRHFRLNAHRLQHRAWFAMTAAAGGTARYRKARPIQVE